MSQQCDWDISVEDLKQLTDAGVEFLLIDVREQVEYEVSEIGGRLIPLGTLAEHIESFDPDHHIVVHCKSGGRSAHAVKLLRANGFSNTWNVHGGLIAWIARIDPELPLG
ncbi:MAG: rhodanese-like domain-containing protein [Deltaproteobacteria bacterium]|nr:rhodanese-like domain-containing protein [Deltaproteobacteria bacterium]MBW2294888.1 rhodanese-like domain-containing protein [Deltaproteobacteria bacterium]MBW2387055.1 rhodanese-like domain-containing protein [Deltaproteobacteria bacterium]MBW2723960.1 rhodanese-like domain-containing protein [Deltaproteobacteria bacterium]